MIMGHKFHALLEQVFELGVKFKFLSLMYMSSVELDSDFNLWVFPSFFYQLIFTLSQLN